MSLPAFDGLDDPLTWLGVGNIAGILVRRNRSARATLLRPRTFGYSLPALRAELLPVAPGGLLILVTDGIGHNAVDRISQDDEPRRIADYIASNFRNEKDDGLVPVVRYMGRNT